MNKDDLKSRNLISREADRYKFIYYILFIKETNLLKTSVTCTTSLVVGLTAGRWGKAGGGSVGHASIICKCFITLGGSDLSTCPSLASSVSATWLSCKQRVT